jgi:hypothetical protein
LLVLVVLLAVIVSQAHFPSTHSEAKGFVNGKWFTGKEFEPKTFYTVEGYLAAQKPAGPVRMIDLRGGFVVPAFADADIHS